MRAAIYWGREAFVVLFRHPRFGKRVERIALRHLHSQVKDPELRSKLKPNFAIGCKRILPSNEWYPALAQPNVEVVTDGIREVRPHSIVTADGTEREVDTIVFGTGFHVTDIPIAGHDPRARRPHAWRRCGTGAPRPTSAPPWPATRTSSCSWARTPRLGHTSIVFMIESQINHVWAALQHDAPPRRHAWPRCARRSSGRTTRS